MGEQCAPILAGGVRTGLLVCVHPQRPYPQGGTVGASPGVSRCACGGACVQGRVASHSNCDPSSPVAINPRPPKQMSPARHPRTPPLLETSPKLQWESEGWEGGSRQTGTNHGTIAPEVTPLRKGELGPPLSPPPPLGMGGHFTAGICTQAAHICTRPPPHLGGVRFQTQRLASTVVEKTRGLCMPQAFVSRQGEICN